MSVFNNQRTLTYFVRGSFALGTADLLFVLFGFNCFAYAEVVTNLLVWIQPNKSSYFCDYF